METELRRGYSHRQTKEAANRQTEPTATAPHPDYRLLPYVAFPEADVAPSSSSRPVAAINSRQSDCSAETLLANQVARRMQLTFERARLCATPFFVCRSEAITQAVVFTSR